MVFLFACTTFTHFNCCYEQPWMIFTWKLPGAGITKRKLTHPQCDAWCLVSVPCRMHNKTKCTRYCSDVQISILVIYLFIYQGFKIHRPAVSHWIKSNWAHVFSASIFLLRNLNTECINITSSQRYNVDLKRSHELKKELFCLGFTLLASFTLHIKFLSMKYSIQFHLLCWIAWFAEELKVLCWHAHPEIKQF